MGCFAPASLDQETRNDEALEPVAVSLREGRLFRGQCRTELGEYSARRSYKFDLAITA